MIDLNWKIMFLSEVDREKYASQIDALINKLYQYETPEGGWPYPFDKTAKAADFISYNSVLALAEAGRRPDSDEHLARAVKPCSPHSVRKEVGKVIQSIKALILCSARRSLQ